MFKVGQEIFVGTEFEHGPTRAWGITKVCVTQVFLINAEFASHYYVDYTGDHFMRPVNVGPQANLVDASWAFATKEEARLAVAARIAQRIRLAENQMRELARQIASDENTLKVFAE